MHNLGIKISELRKKSAMTQSELAEALGVSAQAVSKWEIGSSYPDISLMPKLAKILNTSIDYLLIDENLPETRYENPTESKKNINDMILKIKVLDKGDKVNVNLPLALFKMGIDLSSSLNLNGNNLNDKLKNIDFNTLIAMAEKGILGKLVEIEGADGEIVTISIE
ncbi:helix-turn-helix domain-containing protein [Peptoniphilaceae bacterium SGI.131]